MGVGAKRHSPEDLPSPLPKRGQAFHCTGARVGPGGLVWNDVENVTSLDLQRNLNSKKSVTWQVLLLITFPII